jgi:hypothetical protein
MNTVRLFLLCLAAALITGCGSGGAGSGSVHRGHRLTRLEHQQISAVLASRGQIGMKRLTCLELAGSPALQLRYLAAIAKDVHSRTRPMLDVEHTARTLGVQMCKVAGRQYVPWSSLLTNTRRAAARETAATPANLAPIKTG